MIQKACIKKQSNVEVHHKKANLNFINNLLESNLSKPKTPTPTLMYSVNHCV